MNNNLILVCSLILKRVARFDLLSSIENHVVEKRLEQINKTFSFLNWIIPFKFGFKGVCLQTVNCSNLFCWHSRGDGRIFCLTSSSSTLFSKQQAFLNTHIVLTHLHKPKPPGQKYDKPVHTLETQTHTRLEEKHTVSSLYHHSLSFPLPVHAKNCWYR